MSLIRMVIGFWLGFNFPSYAFKVQVSDAPDNDLSLTTSAILGAKQSVLLNIYEFTSTQIANALVDRIRAGVHVEIIEEGEPVGGLSQAGKKIQAKIVQAMQAAGAQDRWLEMTSRVSGHRRYHFDHAKYIVIDGDSLLIGSENYSPSGQPQEGAVGNRGWEVFIHEPSISSTFHSIFLQDSDVSKGDLLDRTGVTKRLAAMLTPVGFAPMLSANSAPPAARPVMRQVPPTFEASDITRITSPDNSLSGLLSMLGGATSKIDLEQMTFSSSWGGPGVSSPLFKAVVDAAKRGVRVRVLLNDENAFDGGGAGERKNVQTVNALNQMASQGGLSLQAKIANVGAMGVDYIHNKGALVDADKTLISSINWNENSVDKNREAAVLVTSPEVHDFYELLFERDWAVSRQTF